MIDLETLEAQFGAGPSTNQPQNNPIDNKLSNLEAKKQAKIQQLQGKTDKLLGMEDADTFVTSNLGKIREAAPNAFYDAVELPHQGSPLDLSTKSPRSASLQQAQIGRILGKPANEVTEQDFIDVGNQQQIQKLADLVREPGDERWEAPLVRGLDAPTNLTGRYVDSKGNRVNIPLDIPITTKPLESTDKFSRNLASVGTQHGENVTAQTIQDPNLNASIDTRTKEERYRQALEEYKKDRELSKIDELTDLGYWTNAAKGAASTVGSLATGAVGALFDAGANVGQKASEFLGREVTDDDLRNLNKLGFRLDEDGKVRHYWSWEEDGVDTQEAFDNLLGVNREVSNKAAQKFNESMDEIWGSDASLLDKVGGTISLAVESKEAIPPAVADSLTFLYSLTKQPLAMLAGATNEHLEERLKNGAESADFKTTLGIAAGTAVELGVDFIVDRLALGMGKGLGKVNQKIVDGMFKVIPDRIKENVLARVITGLGKRVGRVGLAAAEEAPTEAFQEALGLILERAGTEKYDGKKLWGLLDEETQEQIRHAGYQGLLVGAGQSAVGQAAGLVVGDNAQDVRKSLDEAGQKIKDAVASTESKEVEKEAKKAEESVQATVPTDEEYAARNNEIREALNNRRLGTAHRLLNQYAAEIEEGVIGNINKKELEEFNNKANELRAELKTRLQESKGEVTPEIQVLLGSDQASIDSMFGDTRPEVIESLAASIKRTDPESIATKTALENVAKERKSLEEVSTELRGDIKANLKTYRFARSPATKDEALRNLSRIQAFQTQKVNRLTSHIAEMEDEVRASIQADINEGRSLDEILRKYAGKKDFKYANEKQAPLEVNYRNVAESVYGQLTGTPVEARGAYKVLDAAKRENREVTNILNGILDEELNVEAGVAVNENTVVDSQEQESVVEEEPAVTEEIEDIATIEAEYDAQRTSNVGTSTRKAKQPSLVDSVPTIKTGIKKRAATVTERSDESDIDELIEKMPKARREWMTRYRNGELPATEARTEKYNTLIEEARKEYGSSENTPVQKQSRRKDDSVVEAFDEGERKAIEAEGRADSEKQELKTSQLKTMSDLVDRAVANGRDFDSIETEIKLSFKDNRARKEILSYVSGLKNKAKGMNILDRAYKPRGLKRSQAKTLLEATSRGVKTEKLAGEVKREFEAKKAAVRKTLDKIVEHRPGFALQDSPLQLLMTQEGKYPEELVDAMTIGINTYLAERLPELVSNDDTQIGKMLDIDVINSRAREKFRTLGRFESNEAAGLGQLIMKNVGVKPKSSASYNLESRMVSDAGATALAVLEEMGIVERRTDLISVPELAYYRGTDAEKAPYDAKQAISVIRLNPKVKGRVNNAPRWLSVTKRAQAFGDAVNEEIGAETYQKKPRLRKRRKHEFKTRNAENFVTIPESKQEVLNKAENTAYEIDQDAIKILKEMWGTFTENEETFRSTQQKRVAELFGWSDPSNEHVDFQDNVKAKNREIIRSVENLLRFADEAANNDVYFDYFFSKNGRFFIDSAKINPQTDKLHRFIINVKQENKKVTDETRDVFKMAVVQAFDGSTVVDIGQGDGSSETVNGEIVRGLGAVDKQSQEETLRQFDKIIANPKVKAAIEAVKTQDPRMGRRVILAIEGVDHPAHAMMAIKELAKFSEVKDFETNMTMETDAVTSGFILGLLTNPVMPFKKLASWLAKGGVWFGLKVPKSYGEWRGTSGNLDSYETGAMTANSLLDRTKHKTLTKVIGDIDRKMMKSPLMTFVYGAGLASISRHISEDKAAELIKELASDKSATMARSMVRIMHDAIVTYNNEIRELRNKKVDSKIDKDKMIRLYKIRMSQAKKAKMFLEEGLKKNNPKEFFKNSSMSKTDMKAVYESLKSAIGSTYGLAIGTALETEFEELVEMRKIVNLAFTGMFGAFKAEYDKRLAKKQGSKTNPSTDDVNSVLAEMMDEGLVPGVFTVDGEKASDKAPIIKMERSTDNREQNKVQVHTKPQRTVHPLIYDMVANPTAGAVITIHYLDGAIISKIIEDSNGLGIHDAFVTHVNNVVDETRKYNKNVVNMTQRYDLIGLVLKDFDKITKLDIDAANNAMYESLSATQDVTEVSKDDVTNIVGQGLTVLKSVVDTNKQLMSEQTMTSAHMAGPNGSMYTRKGKRPPVEGKEATIKLVRSTEGMSKSRQDIIKKAIKNKCIL